MQRRRSRSQRTRLGRILLRAKGQPRAMNRALSCRWQHAAMYLRVPRVAPTSRAATSSLARERLASPRLISPRLALPFRTSSHLTSPHPIPPHPHRHPHRHPYLTSPHPTSSRTVSSCLASSHLASRPRARKQRVFAACALLRATAFLPPFSRIRVYIFLRQLNRADS